MRQNHLSVNPFSSEHEPEPFERCEPDLIDLCKVYKASEWEMFRKVRIKNSLPYIFDAFKISVPLALIAFHPPGVDERLSEYLFLGLVAFTASRLRTKIQGRHSNSDFALRQGIPTGV